MAWLDIEYLSCTVHPHGCGEHFDSSLTRSTRDGSSPRVWGTSVKGNSRRLMQRFIPTGVGNIWPGRERGGPSPVHPHGCGEHLLQHRPIQQKDGSSPRVWGTSLGCRHGYPRPRFIPTGVGNMGKKECKRGTAAVHPHGCGEHLREIAGERTGVGSSPRVWGTYLGEHPQVAVQRFIPTGVGNIHDGVAGLEDLAVHPHGCGEHSLFWFGLIAPLGSSPRVWGTFPKDNGISKGYRFIPTGVGNISARTRALSFSSVHPHGCGEHPGHEAMIETLAGSSPRVWGT